MGRPPLGDEAMTAAERQRRHREKQAPDGVTEPVTKPNDAEVATLRRQLSEAQAQLSAMNEQLKRLTSEPPTCGAYGKPFSRQMFTELLMALHPDQSTPERRRDMLNRLLKSKDDLQPTRQQEARKARDTMPIDLAEMMRRREQVRAMNSAKAKERAAKRKAARPTACQ